MRLEDEGLNSDSTEDAPNSVRRPRFRKSKEQLRLLAEEFKNNPKWTNDQVTLLSEMTGLSKAKVYKWHWDQRKKSFLDEEPVEEPNLISNETLDLSQIEYALFYVERSFRHAINQLQHF